MKSITLPVAELKPALAGLGKVIGTRPSLAILAHVKIERSNDGWIAITGTDLDRYVTMRLEHPAKGPPVSILLPYDQLVQITKSCGKGESIEVEATPESSVIRFPLGDKFGETKVAFVSPDEFPLLPKIKSDTTALPPGLRESILEAMDCASVDDSRRVLNGTYIDVSNPQANYIVGTDGRHLYSANSFALPLKQGVIIPTHKFIGWKDFANDGEWQMKVGAEHIQLSTRRWRFITKAIDGTYPDWRAPIPSPSATQTVLTLNPAKLETLIKLIQRMPCHDDRYHTLGLEWQAGQLMLMGKDKAEEPWLRVPVPEINGTGPDMQIYADRRYVIKALGFGLNVISLIDPLSPLRFTSGGKQLIVMPVRCEASPTSVNTTAQSTANTAVTTPKPQPPTVEQTIPTPMQTPATGKPYPATTNGTTTPASATTADKQEAKSTLEAALVQVESIKTSFREAISGLTKLGDSIRQSLREQKAGDKDVQSLRQTLRSLQGLRI